MQSIPTNIHCIYCSVGAIEDRGQTDMIQIAMTREGGQGHMRDVDVAGINISCQVYMYTGIKC